jgi:maltoporin
MDEQCSAQVYHESSFHGYCLRSGTVEDGGEWYCWQHSPAAFKARREASNRKWQEESAYRDARLKAVKQVHDNAIWNEAIEAAAKLAGNNVLGHGDRLERLIYTLKRELML